MLIFIFLFIQNAADAKSDLTFLWWILGVVLLIGAALIILLSKRKEHIQDTETKRANSNADLIKTRDIEICDLKNKIARLEADIESVTIEYKTLVGIDIAKLFNYWTIKENKEAEILLLESRIRVLERLVKNAEAGDIHNTSG